MPYRRYINHSATPNLHGSRPILKKCENYEPQKFGAMRRIRKVTWKVINRLFFRP